MTVTQAYRNPRQGFYTDLTVDTTPVGAIVPNLKTGQNSFDHSFVKYGATAFPILTESAGDAYLLGDDPAYTHHGYLYCDGSEYNISDFPSLFEILGNKYGGRASSGIDVVDGGSGYTSAPSITISAPPAGGVTATCQAIVEAGKVKQINVLLAGKGYTSAPTLTLSGGGGSGASFAVRLDEEGSILGITTVNVMDMWGDPYLGTFCVPDMVTKKVVGNGPVFGQNSPNIGNSQLGVGTTGGAWYLAKEQQDEFFSLGRIVTTGYENVVETVECSMIGQQQVEISMRETKLSGVFQHNHSVYHAQPGFNIYQAESSGDRYLQDYREGRGRLSRWYPTGGIVFTHKHGLLRSPITDNTIATYDVFDAVGGAGGCGSIKDPTVASSEQFYMASGASDAGTYEFQTYIPDPTMSIFTGSSQIGGRAVNTGGTPVYDYSDEWEFTSAGSYSINLGNITGTPDKLIYELVGGGGSGAAGNVQGNDGGDTVMTVGSVLTLTAEGGTKGGASNGQIGGTGGTGGTAAESGSAAIYATGSFDGQSGGAGGNGQTPDGFPLADYPDNPDGGGAGGAGNGGGYGAGTAGINLLQGGQSGTYTETLTADGSFNTGAVANPTSVQITLNGGKGGAAGRGGYTGYNGATIVVDMVADELEGFYAGGWSFVRGTAAGGRMNGSSTAGGNGGYGGEGHQEADGGGGGGSSMIKRGTQILIGAGGGGGAGASGYDGGAGVNGSGPPSGYSQPDGTTQALGPGGGGTGGHYGCIGGGGGGGGSGVARNGITFGGIGNGGASGGPGGAPGGDGGHQGGGAGQSGVSSYRTDYFTLNSFSHSNDYGGTNNGNGWANITAVYNNDYWTSGGGGGGGGALWAGDIDWSWLNNPGSISVTVGGAGLGINPGGQTTGTTSTAESGYAKIGLGKIVGYTGGSTGISEGDIITSGSQTSTVWDVNIVGNGGGTGAAGDFKLPTTQVPDVYIVGGGATTAAQASVTVANNKVTAVSLDSSGAGYTEIPYVYVMNGAGGKTKVTSTIDTQAENVDALFLAANSSQVYTNYVKFGGLSGSTGTRFIELKPVDTTNTNYFSIKACRGNGVNGGNVPEEVLRVYYQAADSTGWTLIDTIITPNSVRTDPIIGDVPIVSQAWDGGSGATQWYTYSVALPTDAKAVGTKIKIEQPRATPSAANDNDADSDHYGICEFIYWNEKVTGLVFVPTAGKISKPAVDSLSYTIQGETGPGITYSSGASPSEATLTLKSTTKIEPQATIDPDIDVPLLTPYTLCKYLIKAF